MMAICLLSAGCGGGVDQSSPQAVAEGFKNAAQNDDWPTAFTCLTDESQDLMLMPVAIFGGFSMANPKSEEAKDMQALLEKHGVDLNRSEDAFKDIKDKGALFGDFVAWSKKHADKKSPKKDLKSQIADIKFENFQVDGDTATCDSGKHQTHFTKIDGKWYLDLATTMKTRRKATFTKLRK